MKRNCYFRKKHFFQQACVLAFLFMLHAGQASANDSSLNNKTLNTIEQEKRVSGKVKDNDGRPIPGVTVVVKGTTIGAITDANGEYILSKAPENGVLNFSFVGMKTQEVSIAGKLKIDMTMIEESIGLDEVVAVGYGTQRKSDITGATSTVKADELVKRPIIRLEQALQGTTPGVSVVSNSGQPGQGLSVKIRGANSITGSSDPLYVIDGNLGGNIEALNPNDIESMEILKDASATAIYGSRGSNGVVLITTKSGKEGAMKVNMNAWFSQASIAKHLDLMNAYDFANVVNTTNISSGGVAAFTDAQLQAFKANGGTDWHKELERNALIQNYQVDLSGGSSSITYRISYNYLNQPGLILNQWYKKSTFRTNLDIKASDKLNLKFNLSAMLPSSRNNGYQGDLTDPFSQANIWDPTSPVRDPQTGAYIRNSTYGSAGFNPVAQANNQFDDNSSRSIVGTGVLTYKITKDLTFTSNNSYDLGSGYSQSFRGLDTDGGNNGANAVVNSNKSWSFQNSNFLTYIKKFGDHSITVTALYEQHQWENTSVKAQATKLSTPSLGYYNLGLGATQQITSGYAADALQSYMGRINYSYKDRYLVTLSYRDDGSSHLTKKYSQFPSMALAWNVMKENFMQNSNLFYGLKIRTSYGETGNQAVGAYATIPRISTGNPYFFDGTTASVTTPLGAPVSPSLVWENTKQTDIGIDASFLRGRLTFTVDAYNKDITNLLYNYQAPYYMGGENYQRNMGSLNNKGIEFSLGGTPVSNDKITWNSYFTLSINRNKVVDLAGLDNVEIGNIGSAQTGASFLKVGRPLGEFIGYEFLGTWKTSEASEAALFGMKPGDAKYVDVNNDHVYNSKDLMPIGNGSPKFVYGFTNDIKYGNFSLSIMLQGMYGNQIYSQTLAYIWGGQGQAKTPTTKDALNMWTPTNETDNPAFSKTGKSFINSSRYVYDASFMKVKNLSFSYHVPETMLKKVGVSNLEIYVSGQNIFTITKYPGYDPEVNNAQNAVTQGLEMGVIPNPRTYTFGFRLGL